MGIRFHCHNCTKKLHVKTFLAGKRGVCPHCGGSVRIPLESTAANGQRTKQRSQKMAVSQARAAEPTASEQAATVAPTHVLAKPVILSQPQKQPNLADAVQPSNTRIVPVDPIAESPESVWYVQPPSGGQFGPASGDIFQRWIGEGRVSAESFVWREDWSNWQRAGDVLPQLVTSPTAPPPVAGPHCVGTSSNVTDQKPAIDVPLPPQSETVPSARLRRRRRSNTPTIAAIVTLCIISLVLLVALLIVLVGGGGS